MQVDGLSYVGRIQQLRPDSLTRAASDALPRHLAEALDSDWPAIYLPFGTVLNNTFTAAVAALGRLQEVRARCSVRWPTVSRSSACPKAPTSSATPIPAKPPAPVLR
jgi:hypothetical protein